MQYLIFMLLLLTISFPFSLVAQSYNLENLIIDAVEKNTVLKQARINLEIAKVQNNSTKINFLPEVSVDLGRNEDIENNSKLNSMSYGMSYLIALNYDAYYSNKNAKHDLNTANISLQLQLQNTIYEIMQSYIFVLEEQKRLDLLEENVNIQDSIVSEGFQLFNQQRITQFEYQQSEINL